MSAVPLPDATHFSAVLHCRWLSGGYLFGGLSQMFGVDAEKQSAQQVSSVETIKVDTRRL